MPTIKDFANGYYGYDYNYGYDFSSNYSNNYSNNKNAFLSGVSFDAYGTRSFDLTDYSMIKNGTYGKLLKAYYAQEKQEKSAVGRDDRSKLTLMAGTAGALSKSAQALMSESLWKKKVFVEKKEDSGEEVSREDYNWKEIVKAVKSFVDDYNSTLDKAGESNNRDVLRNAVWMTSTTSANSKMLEKVGITIGSGNKLQIDEEKLKNSDISTLKTLFTGYNSLAEKMMKKGEAISLAARCTGQSYTNTGKYYSPLSDLVSSTIDKKK